MVAPGNRLVSIDVIKFFSISLVILFHVLYNLSFDRSLRVIGFIGVSLFFIVSGFLLAKTYPRVTHFDWKFFLHRLFCIIPLYYLTLIAIAFLFGSQVYDGNLFLNLFSHFLFFDFYISSFSYAFISPAWFLTPLVFLYLFFPFLNRYIKQNKGFLFLVFSLSVLFRLYANTWTSFSPLFFIGDFCFGIAFAQGRKGEALAISTLSAFVNFFMLVPYVLFYLLMRLEWNLLPKNFTRFFSSIIFALFLFHESILKTSLGRWNVLGLSRGAGLTVLLIVFIAIFFISEYVRKRALASKFLNKK